MSKEKVTTKIFIDKYHPKANGECAISIRVTSQRKKRYYPTPITLSVDDFQKAFSDKAKKKTKMLALELQAYEKKAADIIYHMPVFTWAMFEKKYLSNRIATKLISTAFDNYISELEKAGRIGTAVSYRCSKNSLELFKPDSQFIDITPSYLQEYEKWMLGKEKSITTIGIYLRQLRTIFNLAINDGILAKELYPFGKRKYEIPTGRNIKKALSIEDIEKIYTFQPKTLNAQRAKDYWFFIYLCNGINVKDMALLKFKDIEDDIIKYQRSKTATTKRNSEPIRVILNSISKNIIKKWANENQEPSNYVFPIISTGLTLKRERELIQQQTKTINKHMRIIAKDLNFPVMPTTYVARHSFATILKKGDVSIEMISEMLGHGSTKTTQRYLANFDDKIKATKMELLTSFLKNDDQ